VAQAGRPTDYNEDLHPKLAQALSEIGLTDEQMAERMGIATSTFYDWKSIHPLFSESIQKGKIGPDDEVELSLRKRALGYNADETTKEPIGIKERELLESMGVEVPEFVTTKIVNKHIPGDVAAAFIWLKNRRPKQWRDRQEIGFESDENPIRIQVDHTIDIKNTDTVEVHEPRKPDDKAD